MCLVEIPFYKSCMCFRWYPYLTVIQTFVIMRFYFATLCNDSLLMSGGTKTGIKSINSRESKFTRHQCNETIQLHISMSSGELHYIFCRITSCINWHSRSEQFLECTFFKHSLSFSFFLSIPASPFLKIANFSVYSPVFRSKMHWLLRQIQLDH